MLLPGGLGLRLEQRDQPLQPCTASLQLALQLRRALRVRLGLPHQRAHLLLRRRRRLHEPRLTLLMSCQLLLCHSQGCQRGVQRTAGQKVCVSVARGARPMAPAGGHPAPARAHSAHMSTVGASTAWCPTMPLPDCSSSQGLGGAGCTSAVVTMECTEVWRSASASSIAELAERLRLQPAHNSSTSSRVGFWVDGVVGGWRCGHNPSK